jgi:hypothetical protein
MLVSKAPLGASLVLLEGMHPQKVLNPAYCVLLDNFLQNLAVYHALIVLLGNTVLSKGHHHAQAAFLVPQLLLLVQSLTWIATTVLQEAMQLKQQVQHAYSVILVQSHPMNALQAARNVLQDIMPLGKVWQCVKFAIVVQSQVNQGPPAILVLQELTTQSQDLLCAKFALLESLQNLVQLSANFALIQGQVLKVTTLAILGNSRLKAGVLVTRLK